MKAMVLERNALIESSPLRLAEAARIPVRPRTTVYPLEQANQALQDLKADRINGTGVLVVGP